MYIDGHGGTHEVDLKDVQTSKADMLCKASLHNDNIHIVPWK